MTGGAPDVKHEFEGSLVSLVARGTVLVAVERVLWCRRDEGWRGERWVFVVVRFAG